MIGTPYGQPVPVRMIKGFFDNPENFKTETEYQEYLEMRKGQRTEDGGQTTDGKKGI